jgi:predicted  nucleic acid-binding Zn-ribbon protein
MAELRKTNREHERMKDSADASAQALEKLLKRVEQLEKRLAKKT